MDHGPIHTQPQTPNPKTLIMQSSTRPWGKEPTCEKSLSVQCEYSLDRDVDRVKPIVLKHHLGRKCRWTSSTHYYCFKSKMPWQKEYWHLGKRFHTEFKLDHKRWCFSPQSFFVGSWAGSSGALSAWFCTPSGQCSSSPPRMCNPEKWKNVSSSNM